VHVARRRNGRSGRCLRKAGNVFGGRPGLSEKSEKNCPFFRNLNSDRTLRSHEYYTFGARGYTSMPAVVTVAGQARKVPASRLRCRFFLGLPRKSGSIIFRRLLS
jgi:hypothetical protein